jgi:DMSO/TMAO reductase YedYZ molybdopterin-dependent catalytic subunit/thiosulfate reductase cytochrome b subunit
MLILIRSGIQILADHPKLYWTDHTTGDNYWLKFGKKKMPKDKLWTSLDEAEDVGKYALPSGNHNLGAGRHWHFTAAIIWVATGLVYIGYLFTSGEWRRLIPTDWGVIGRAYETIVTYLSFERPPLEHFQPYDGLQQITYAGVVFILAPMMIMTGLAMSPALVARFPKYLNFFAKRRQVARSLHFLGMVGFSLFGLMHITMSTLVYFTENVRKVTLGSAEADLGLALGIFAAAIMLLLAFNIWITFFTLNHQVKVRAILTRFYTPVVRLLFGRMRSHQNYKKKDISPFFRVNGYPPATTEYDRLKAADFKDWKLKVGGMVEQPLELTLDQIKQLPKNTQITKHNCIQGWTAVGEWGGVHMKEIIKACKPSKKAKYVVFHSYDEDKDGVPFYESLRMRDMQDRHTILAYEMNGRMLPVEHGAPLRLRCETKYGYKMAKYLKSIEFVEDFKHIGDGRGGYREDKVFFDWEASI